MPRWFHFIAAACGASALGAALYLYFANQPQEDHPATLLSLPTEYGEAVFTSRGKAVDLHLADFSLELENTKSVRFLRENDMGGFFLLALEKIAQDCPQSLIYLLVSDGRVSFSQEFGSCLHNIEPYEDWTGNYVKGVTSNGEERHYRLEFDGGISLHEPERDPPED